MEDDMWYMIPVLVGGNGSCRNGAQPARSNIVAYLISNVWRIISSSYVSMVASLYLKISAINVTVSVTSP